MAKKYRFRLKHGSHITGTVSPEGESTIERFSAKGSNNIVESDEDLAKTDPDKWERLDNDSYEGSIDRFRSSNKNLDPNEARKRISELRQMARTLEDSLPDDEEESTEKSKVKSTAPAQPNPPGENPEKAQTSPTTQPLPSNLEAMSANDLKALATQRGIDLKGATSRTDIIKVLKESSK